MGHTVFSKRFNSPELKHSPVPWLSGTLHNAHMFIQTLADAGGLAGIISGMRFSDADHVMQAHYFPSTNVNVR